MTGDGFLRPVQQQQVAAVAAIAAHDAFLLQGFEGLGHGRVTDAEIRGGLAQAGYTSVLIDVLFQIIQQALLLYGNVRVAWHSLR